MVLIITVGGLLIGNRLFPYKYKEYINIDKDSTLNGLINNGVYLTITALHENPQSEFCINLFVSKGNGQHNPNNMILSSNVFKMSLGWYNTIGFIEGKPSGNIDFVSYKLL